MSLSVTWLWRKCDPLIRFGVSEEEWMHGAVMLISVWANHLNSPILYSLSIDYWLDGTKFPVTFRYLVSSLNRKSERDYLIVFVHIWLQFSLFVFRTTHCLEIWHCLFLSLQLETKERNQPDQLLSYKQTESRSIVDSALALEVWTVGVFGFF
jgi:hypothetical protein